MFGMIPFGHNDSDLFATFDHFARDFFRNSNADLPAFRTDIRDNGESYLLEADLPGFRKEDINLDVKDNVLTVSARHETEHDEREGKYLRRERRYGSFSRSFDVSGINESEISASYEDGVLKLQLPKAQPQIPDSRRIDIQ